VPREEPHPAKI